MDPDKCLKDALEIARASVESDDESARQLADALLALDEWILLGGFLPARWRDKHLPSVLKAAEGG